MEIKQTKFALWLILLLSLNLKGQDNECNFVLELDRFTIENTAIGDTTYKIVSDSIYFECILLSCEGDCYVREVDWKSKNILSEGFYKGSDKQEQVEMKVMDPEDESSFVIEKSIYKSAKRMGLWTYRDKTGRDLGKKVFLNGEVIWSGTNDHSIKSK